MSAIWANQVNEISSARKCQTQVFPVGMTRFSLCQAAHLSLPGSWQVPPAEGKPFGGCLVHPICRAQSQCMYPKWR